MITEQLAKEYSELAKAFNSLSSKSEETIVELSSMLKIATGYFDLINSETSSSNNPSQYINQLKRLSDNKKIISNNIDSMKKYFSINSKQCVGNLRKMIKEIKCFLWKLGALRMQRHKFRERSQMQDEEKASYIRGMKKVVLKTEKISDQNLHFEKALIDLKNQINTYSVREHDLYLQINSVNNKINQITDTFPYKSQQLPLLYKEYITLLAEKKSSNLKQEKLQRRLQDEKKGLEIKILNNEEKACYLENISLNKLNSLCQIIDLKEANKLLSESAQAISFSKMKIQRELHNLLNLRTRLTQVNSDVEFLKKGFKEKGNKIMKIELDSIEAISNTHNRLANLEKQRQEELNQAEHINQTMKDKNKETRSKKFQLEKVLANCFEKEIITKTKKKYLDFKLGFSTV